MRTLKLITYSLLASSALFIAQSTQAELVYSNISGTPTAFNIGGIEVGDEIILAGTSRILTEFRFQYFGVSFSGTEKAQFRIYANDGPGLPGEKAPATLLYDSGVFGNILPGDHTFTFNNFGSWDRVVPDSFTWSIQFSDLGVGAEAGVALFDPVTVGGNYADYWEKNNGSWTLKAGAQPINFGATVQAVPEPSTLALGAIGIVVGVFAFRRRQRQ